ncbi:MAG: MarR family transcriptional regulator [Actinobacteria bacterium HGW-Actinobacteria-5]|jgi:DNA-binding MarR family transcriptional regulator|nr:MAG: MarR family transcriptional regulator [Actinobacteria bacterium HGW-Actinobacteria-5]
MSASRRSSEAGQVEGNLIDMLAQSAFVTMGALTRLAAENDLSLTQLRVLAILRDRRLRMSDLIDYLGLEKSTITGLVARAEKRGLLCRAPNAADGRAIDVFLSEEGRAHAERLAADLARFVSQLTDVLTVAERDQLGILLGKMITPLHP